MTRREADRNEIHQMLEVYFEALYHADPQALSQVICDDGLYVCTTPGDYMNMNIPDYLAVVEKREAPAKRQEVRREKVISIAFGGPDMAFVMLTMTMMGREYTDFLTLYRHTGHWKIISKIFSYTQEGT